MYLLPPGSDVEGAVNEWLEWESVVLRAAVLGAAVNAAKGESQRKVLASCLQKLDEQLARSGSIVGVSEVSVLKRNGSLVDFLGNAYSCRCGNMVVAISVVQRKMLSRNRGTFQTYRKVDTFLGIHRRIPGAYCLSSVDVKKFKTRLQKALSTYKVDGTNSYLALQAGEKYYNLQSVAVQESPTHTATDFATPEEIESAEKAWKKTAKDLLEVKKHDENV